MPRHATRTVRHAAALLPAAAAVLLIAGCGAGTGPAASAPSSSTAPSSTAPSSSAASPSATPSSATPSSASSAASPSVASSSTTFTAADSDVLVAAVREVAHSAPEAASGSGSMYEPPSDTRPLTSGKAVQLVIGCIGGQTLALDVDAGGSRTSRELLCDGQPVSVELPAAPRDEVSFTTTGPARGWEAHEWYVG